MTILTSQTVVGIDIARAEVVAGKLDMATLAGKIKAGGGKTELTTVGCAAGLGEVLDPTRHGTPAQVP